MKKFWDYGNLKVSENGRYLQNGSKPFFWMGDTAWLLFQELTLEETYCYLKNRKEKGYNIILVDFIHLEHQKNRAGNSPLFNDDFGKPNDDSGYWSHIDKVIDMAEELGLYMGLLPVWGSSIVKEGFLNMTNVKAYMDFVLKRFLRYPNLIWIVGGDVRGSAGEDVFNTMGEMMKEYNPERLVTYHPFGRTSSTLWFHDKKWLDFNMFQSGHRRYDQASLGAWDDNAVTENYFGEDNWRYVEQDYKFQPPKPTIDGEPSYEQILQGLHNESEPYWLAKDVRRYAYWAVFAGAFGHTYGHNSIMQFYADTTKKGAFGAKSLWQDALHHPGGSQMKHLADLMKQVDFIKGYSAQEILLSEQEEKYNRIVIFAGEDFIYCYDYNGIEFKIDLKSYEGKKLEAYWFDPVCGVYSFIKEVTDCKELTVKPEQREESRDFVLVVKEVK